MNLIKPQLFVTPSSISSFIIEYFNLPARPRKVSVINPDAIEPKIGAIHSSPTRYGRVKKPDTFYSFSRYSVPSEGFQRPAIRAGAHSYMTSRAVCRRVVPGGAGNPHLPLECRVVSFPARSSASPVTRKNRRLPFCPTGVGHFGNPDQTGKTIRGNTVLLTDIQWEAGSTYYQLWPSRDGKRGRPGRNQENTGSRGGASGRGSSTVV